MRKENFSKLMFILAGSFGATIEILVVNAWYKLAMKDGLTLEQVSGAVQKIIKEKTNSYGRMVTWAEILQEIDKKPDVKDIAVLEANKILAHLQNYGASKHPRIDHPITQRLMATRWPYQRWAASVLESELVWWKKEFVEAFEAEARAGSLFLGSRIKGLIENIGDGGENKSSITTTKK